jgi:hypothetical protein
MYMTAGEAGVLKFWLNSGRKLYEICVTRVGQIAKAVETDGGEPKETAAAHPSERIVQCIFNKSVCLHFVQLIVFCVTILDKHVHVCNGHS